MEEIVNAQYDQVEAFRKLTNKSNPHSLKVFVMISGEQI